MKMRRFLAFTLVLVMMLCGIPFAFAATVDTATIDDAHECSITLYKYDFTNAKKDGVWNEDSFTSTGWQESYVETTLGTATRKGDTDSSSALGNGQSSNGYAIKGVEFTTLKVADITTFSESANDQHPDYNLTQVLYGFNKVKAAALLTAIGLPDGASHYANADSTDKLNHAENWYYTADTLNTALRNAAAANSVALKNALEAYIGTEGTKMPLTDENGMTTVSGLPVGLYLMVETKVPEMVTSTTAPFFVSLPMTTVTGNSHSNSPAGGSEWNYDVTLYPKNETGIVTLEKTVREAQADTGKNEGSGAITDGYAHNATGSAGDVMEYQIISTLPTITSKSTFLTTYTLQDVLSKGLAYTEDAVVVEWYSDKACAAKVATWQASDGKFTVSKTANEDGSNTMTIAMTAEGLAEINGNYSNHTLRVTYKAKINSDESVIYGTAGNPNEVVLTWKRTSTSFYDTLVDDCHVYTFGFDVTKKFSDDNPENLPTEDTRYMDVHFVLQNQADNYFVTAALNEGEGIWYVTGHVATEEEATIFHPVTWQGKPGQIVIKGLEDDKYILTETHTANGYTLLQKGISVEITAADDPSRPCDIYGKDILGVIQNDPRYKFDGGLDLHLANIPQAALAHNMLTASATVDGNPVTMLADEVDTTSENALAQLTVLNHPGLDIPPTGENGTMLLVMSGALIFSLAALIFVLALKKKKAN